MKSNYGQAIIIVFATSTIIKASEPNETFETATVVAPGVLSVSDQLTIGTLDRPDTYLGIRDQSGSIYAVDDDSSPVGSGTASGIEGLATSSGSINFAVTGTGDFDFNGSHTEVGAFEAHIKAYNSLGELTDTFSEIGRLDPGAVRNFSFFDADWTNGKYDVYLDNTVDTNEAADVDFFTFIGLTPGSEFAARTIDPGGNAIDTFLGWFDSTGTLLETDDNGAGGNLSLIEGTIPVSGSLTFAVTGGVDEGFIGAHFEEGAYELQLDIGVNALTGDYNRNGTVDAADYVIWRKAVGQIGANLPSDGNGDNQIDSKDYEVWRAHFGTTTVANAITNHQVPEPSAMVALTLVALAALTRRYGAPQ